eukprot:6196122-Pleurochrysis_carterae.AAC.4
MDRRGVRSALAPRVRARHRRVEVDDARVGPRRVREDIARDHPVDHVLEEWRYAADALAREDPRRVALLVGGVIVAAAELHRHASLALAPLLRRRVGPADKRALLAE